MLVSLAMQMRSISKRTCWRRLITAREQHHTIERISMQQLDQPQITQIPIQSRRRSSRSLLDRMRGKLDGNTARTANPLSHALSKCQVVAVTRSQIRARLCDTDDGFMRRQFLFREAVVEVSVEVQGRHTWVVGAIQPLPGPEGFCVFADFA